MAWAGFRAWAGLRVTCRLPVHYVLVLINTFTSLRDVLFIIHKHTEHHCGFPVTVTHIVECVLVEDEKDLP